MMDRRETSLVRNEGRRDSHALNDHRIILKYQYEHENDSFHATIYHVMYSSTTREILLLPLQKEVVKHHVKYWIKF